MTAETACYAQRAGYRAHRVCRAGTLVIYNASEYGWPDADARWIVMLEPSGTFLIARTLKMARWIMARAADISDADEPSL